MKTSGLKTIWNVLFFLIIAAPVWAQSQVFPVRISENGRYFIDQNNNPVFWLGTTQWQIFSAYTYNEAKLTIEKSKSNGFIFIQAMLMGTGDGTKANIYNEKPWLNDNPLTPNEAYFLHVDSVIRAAVENNVIFSITLYHQRYKKYITVDNAWLWAKWLSTRYKNIPNIVWSMTPEAKDEFVPVLRELAKGLHEGDGGSHLITFKPDPSPYTSSFMHQENWLDFNSMQTWEDVKLIYPMVTHDYNLKPVKPVLMAEGAYEHGSEYSFDVTPIWIRRQAYYSYLAGGHHTYGHNDSWRVLPTWRQALDAPGAVQLGILKKIFQDMEEWWYLVPDQAILTKGSNIEGDLLNLAARHKDGKWIIIYLAAKSTISVNLNKITSGTGVQAFWVNPETGHSVDAGSFPAMGEKSFETPANMEDALLIFTGK